MMAWGCVAIEMGYGGETVVDGVKNSRIEETSSGGFDDVVTTDCS